MSEQLLSYEELTWLIKLVKSEIDHRGEPSTDIAQRELQQLNTVLPKLERLRREALRREAAGREYEM